MDRDCNDELLFFDDDCGDCCWGTDEEICPCTVWGINDDEDDISEILNNR